MFMYATVADVEKRYPEDTLVILTKDFNDGSDDWDYSSIIIPNLEAASSEIDSFLSKRYKLPLTVFVEMLRSFCVDIALSSAAPEVAGHAKLIQDRADYARAHLQKIADGEVDLPIKSKNNGSGGEDAGADSHLADIRTSSPKQVFTDDMMGKF